MLNWIKTNTGSIITFLVCIVFVVYGYACEPTVESLNYKGDRLNRVEFQIELDRIMQLAEARLADLDRQERLRIIIMQNALMLAQGQPFNPAGLLTGLAAIYGIGHAGTVGVKTVNNVRKKRKVNNGNG